MKDRARRRGARTRAAYAHLEDLWVHRLVTSPRFEARVRWLAELRRVWARLKAAKAAGDAQGVLEAIDALLSLEEWEPPRP